MSRESAGWSRRAGLWRRLRAVLAGGLVFGIGATLTLAAWNDSEYAAGQFAASTFATESRSNSGAIWVSTTQGSPATLDFAAATMSPTVSHYAYLDVRTTAASTVGGAVALDSASKTGTLAAVLEYRTVLIGSTATCNAAAFSGSPTWVAGGASTYLAGGTMPTTPPNTALSAGAANTLRYCFDVRVTTGAPNTYQGTSGTLTWGFLATSSS
ncbi:SipW-dependent-type signal peptide-containing protein [Raineyella sp. LH-20]|uniref:SipW-dependent-type signal peptide-containing protein n=1 Tax=Raineyella sp. LH-20 TaxID=3081204 RepID=UPI0029549330|nr:SipW-dependent-type signal peptide-containing protein [Raineyella sp. LH-20]WOP19808.1 SipW-dependent-type signal peptide-containing protein [Raineyella sp. LH-20]